MFRHKKKERESMATLYECTTCGGKVSENAKVCPHCGEDGGASDLKAKEFLNINTKSRLTSLILTLLIGPLGLMYSSILWGAILTIIAFLGAPTVVVPLGVWILSILLGDSFTYNHNKRIQSQAQFVS